MADNNVLYVEFKKILGSKLCKFIFPQIAENNRKYYCRFIYDNIMPRSLKLKFHHPFPPRSCTERFVNIWDQIISLISVKYWNQNPIYNTTEELFLFKKGLTPKSQIQITGNNNDKITSIEITI